MDALLALGGGEWMVPALVAGNIALFIAIIAFMTGARARAERRQRKQLDRMRQRFSGNGAAGSDLKRELAGAAMNGLDDAMKRFMPRRQALRDRLERTGRGITVGQYLIVTLAVASIATAAIGWTFRLNWTIAGLSGASVGLLLPHLWIGMLAAGRIKKFIANFPEGIDLIVRGVRSGLPIGESINIVGREIPDPVGEEFRRIEHVTKLGTTLEQSLLETARRIDTPEFKFFVISVSIQRETGGNLAETLANLSEILRKRRQLKLKIRALSSEARASAYIIGSLPFIMFGILMMLNPGYVMQLLYDPRGIMMIGVGLLSLTIGVAVMFKLVRFEI